MKMKVSVAYLLILSLYQNASGFIIPDEIPSLMSLIYSNIPTLKKGTDSRLGWGFRMGDRADFQILVELGPQTNTQQLGNQGDNNNKRDIINNYINELYALRLREKQISDTEGGKFLDQWSKDMTTRQPIRIDLVEPARIKLGLGEVDAKAVIPDDAALQLEELYNKQKPAESSTTSTTTTVRPISTTDAKDALDNVSLD